MIRSTVLAALLLASAMASAGPDDAFFGPIDPGRAGGAPQLIFSKPVQVDGTGGGLVYLHVRPGEEHQWKTRCHRYQACTLQVYFVREEWYRGTYLPSTSGADGERRYVDALRPERANRGGRHRE